MPADDKNLAFRIQYLESDLFKSKSDHDLLVQAINSLEGAVILTDCERKVSIASNGALEIFGYGRDEIIGKDISTIIKGDISDFAWGESLEKDGNWAGECIMTDKEGGPKHVSLSLTMMKDENGGKRGIFGYGVDITGNKLLEERLAQVNAEQSAILDSAGVSIALVKGGKAIWWNKGFERDLGYKSEEHGHLALEDLLTSPEELKFREEKMPELKKGSIIAFEGNLRHADGSHVWMRRIVRAVDPSDMSKGIIVIGEDFSKRKAMEDELRRAKEQAEEATRLKDSFVSLVAHDLKSPFNSILGFLKILEGDENEPLSERQKQILGRVIGSSENMVVMIDNLLNISRLQTGKIKPNMKFFDGHLLAQNAIANLGGLAREKGISLSNQVPKGMRLYGDFSLICEVAMNLVSNSIKFCRAGDAISICQHEGSLSSIAVRDTGPGVPQSILPDIFRHDVKTSMTGSAGEKGTGLGLPFCHDIMAAHEGSMTVASEDGSGTIIVFSLPFKRPVILLVDDNETDRALFRMSLDSLDAEINEAANGQEALDIIGENPPHLVVTDMDMPIVNGAELTRRIAAMDGLKIPVIAITSSSGADSRENAFRAGASDFVTKPINPSDFLPRVKRFFC